MEGLNSDKAFQAWKQFAITGKVEAKEVRKEIAESWKRCLSSHLGPYATRKPIRLSREELVNRRQRYSFLIESSRPFLQILESEVKGSGFIITLTDKDAYVLEVLGVEGILLAVDQYIKQTIDQKVRKY